MRSNARLRSTKLPFAAALIVLLVITLGRGAAPAEEKQCDPRRECEWRWTCFDGLLYPTTCGPANCDAPIMKCQQPSEDWRKQRDIEIRQKCENTALDLASRIRCRARLHREFSPRCGKALTCIDGLMYPSTCGPANREQPIGKCDDMHWYCRRNWNTRMFFQRETAGTVTACLKEGASPNARDKRGFTPLHYAAANNKNPAVAAALIKAGADPNARDEWGVTPLHRAARYNRHPAVAAALIEAGADLDARNKNGATPLDWARQTNPPVAALLQRAGARTGSRGSKP